MGETFFTLPSKISQTFLNPLLTYPKLFLSPPPMKSFRGDVCKKLCTRLLSLLDVVSVIDVHKSTLSWKKKGQIVLQKIIILISTFLPYKHMGITQWCSQVLNIGEGASNQDKPTRYCDQRRRSVFDIGGGIIWWHVSTNCMHGGV